MKFPFPQVNSLFSLSLQPLEIPEFAFPAGSHLRVANSWLGSVQEGEKTQNSNG